MAINMTFPTSKINQLATEYAEKAPRDIINFALQQFDNIGISFSGAEDVVLIDMATKAAKKLGKAVQVFTLDTGRLHPETYQFMEKVRKHYDIRIEVMYPDKEKLEAFVAANGLFSFYDNDHHDCCAIRKIEPLKRKLLTLDAWITGQRRDQSPDTRNEVAVMELDGTFSTKDKPLSKFNPLANWSSEEVWQYIRMFDVPYNSLHDRGFISIGCEPCTRPVGPNQHEREGRWWWEEATAKECGLHQGNLIAKTSD